MTLVEGYDEPSWFNSKISSRSSQVASHFHFLGEGDNNILKILHSKIYLEQCIVHLRRLHLACQCIFHLKTSTGNSDISSLFRNISYQRSGVLLLANITPGKILRSHNSGQM